MIKGKQTKIKDKNESVIVTFMTLCLYTYSLLFNNCEEERIREIKTKTISVTIVPYSIDTIITSYVQLWLKKIAKQEKNI